MNKRKRSKNKVSNTGVLIANIKQPIIREESWLDGKAVTSAFEAIRRIRDLVGIYKVARFLWFWWDNGF